MFTHGSGLWFVYEYLKSKWQSQFYRDVENYLLTNALQLFYKT